ncbi:unnamed protein product [Pleuronectes platessa]|uniref:Uncharacterized protein n=1 Tax=Pleuronectes platessa TaxID=8262 RepID=A0A9N7UL72_PLEPL|nr:unnamed protein product [Pleuronectes platessa]
MAMGTIIIYPRAPTLNGAVSVAGAEVGTGWRGPGTAVGRVSVPSRGSLSYGARWGNPPFTRGPPPAVRLGWRLAARTVPLSKAPYSPNVPQAAYMVAHCSVTRWVKSRD